MPRIARPEIEAKFVAQRRKEMFNALKPNLSFPSVSPFLTHPKLTPSPLQTMIEVVCNDRLGKKVRVKCKYVVPSYSVDGTNGATKDDLDDCSTGGADQEQRKEQLMLLVDTIVDILRLDSFNGPNSRCSSSPFILQTFQTINFVRLFCTSFL
jgi:hypothetical protein